ncbi:MMPL family transporter [Rouxiella sp. S1S-2]|uniref:MMPL family transporter n=1 Tax=Rouxiella sp. S1S-2 TaxID=2653856 RepID=UPI001264CC43|nr:MMPL family transporter [Rouxiella sp. S1S-2]KAB7895553.1 MMPL family transporter [Rouxiella sp. S1S-2]
MQRSSIFLPERHRQLAFGWLIICLVLIAALFWLLPRSQVNSSVLALLPKQQLSGVPDTLSSAFSQRLDRQLMWLVKPPAAEQSKKALEDWLTNLRQLSSLQQVEGPMDAEQQQQWGQFFFNHRNAMLDAATRARLTHGAAAQSQWILGQVYSAFAGVSGKELANDPLLLVRASQMAQQQNGAGMTLDDGWLMAKDAQGQRWYLVHAELRASSYDITSSKQIVGQLDALKTQFESRWPGAEVLERGTVFYSNYASQQAEHDISTLGIASIIGVFALILLMFRSVVPMLLSLLSISIGALAGTVMTLWVFGEIHVMTLVLSTSIVGISADYTLYFLTERRVHGQHSTPLESLKKLFPALSMAMLTTVSAYLMLLIAPFPGMQQLAVFAAAGLSAACITVMCWYPYLAKRLPVGPTPGLTLILRWLHAWRNKPGLRIGLPLAILLLAALGISRLQVNDDIGQLQALPAGLLKQEQKIAALTGQSSEQKWLVVYGENPELTLQRLEALEPRLRQAKKDGILGGYRLLGLPSLQRQEADLALLAQRAPQVASSLQQAGLKVNVADVSAQFVTPQMWQKSVISQGWRLLWLSLPDGRSAALVPVSGVSDSAAMQKMAQSMAGVGWIDRKTEFSSLFEQYRVMLSWLLALAAGVISAIYLWRFRWPHGAICCIPTLLSLAMGVAALGLSGHSLNLFSLLALILVLGIGINYTLFFTNPRGTPTTSMFAIFMAVVTTQLTFGMLVFSSTQAISSFGIVLSSGILTAFVLSPLTLAGKKRGIKK